MSAPASPRGAPIWYPGPVMTRKTLLGPLLLAAACGGTRSAPSTGAGELDPGPTGGAAAGEVADPHQAARQRFANPGGMWMPRQMLAHADQLAELGLQIDAGALSDPTRPPLSAVVSIGGCTASFVSPEGLVVTNHHCVQGALQLNSTPEANLVEHGFLAAARADEKWAGPTQRIYVAQKMTDVSAPMRQGLDEIPDARRRQEELEAREKALVAACEQDRPGLRCTVSSFFRGLEWQLIEYLEIRDVRLVYVPHRAIGAYGGDVDNWAWPRHTGDYAFYRAYVGPDGNPADYAPANVPFRPAAFLKVQPAGVTASDLVLVTGYSGRTHRQQLAAEMRRAMEHTHPRYIEKAKQRMALLDELQQTPGETAIKASVARGFVQNGLEKYSGILEGLQRSDLVQRKESEEAGLRAWAAADPARQPYVQALDALQAKLAEKWATETAEESWQDVVDGSTLLRTALFLVQWAEEQQKPDAARKKGFQERDWPMVLGRQKTFAKTFDRTIDRASWRLMLTRAAADPAAAAWLPELLGLKKGAKVDARAIDKALDGFYGKTTLEAEPVRMGLLAAKPAAVKRSRDPFVKLAVALWPRVKQRQERDEAWIGELALLAPVYAEGLLGFLGGMVAPDANGTLRISYGTVRGYRPAADKEVYAPFTAVTEIPGKNTGEQPFDAPRPLLDLIAAGAWGPYAAPGLGAVPVDFLSDLDITGGNSGSPVLNARGELVGLAFDGNYEGLASDVVFKGETTRMISVDIRYVLWLADALDQADHLLEEMGITPAL
jgi:hypothetical protein